MSIGRYIGLMIGISVLSLALVCWAAITDMHRLQSSLDAVTEEFTELTLVNQALAYSSYARGLLQDQHIKADAINQALTSAIEATDQLIAYQQQTEDEGSEHDSQEQVLARDSRASLFESRSTINQLTQDKLGAWDPGFQIAHLDEVIFSLQDLSTDCEAEVQRAQAESEAVYAAVRWQLSLLVGCAVTLVLIIGLMLYRGVVLPLRRLRHSVREIAAGHLHQRLHPAGPVELESVAHDFNHMTHELESLYADLERKVDQKSRELVRSERLASVGYLAAGVSHEINNPLGIIAGYAELAIKRCEGTGRTAASESRGETDALAANQPCVCTAANSEEVLHSLQIIRDEAFRCKQITSRMLTLAKGSDGTREPVDLARTVRDVCQIASGMSRFGNRQMHMNNRAIEGLRVFACEAEIKQVLLNLIINAIEATDPQQGQVWVEGSHEDDKLYIQVRDNGRGMSAQALDRIFEPFYTEKRGTGDHQSGTGLGLSISHAIIESYDGRLTATSEGSGCGSTFQIELAIYHEEPSHA